MLVLLIYRIGTQPRQAGASTDTSWDRSVSSAGLDTAERPMGFEECNRQIRTLADQLGITPSNIVDSNAMRIVRFSTVDGSVLVTCDAIDDKMIVVKSPSSG